MLRTPTCLLQLLMELTLTETGYHAMGTDTPIGGTAGLAPRQAGLMRASTR
jgi:hypothetical protein